MPWLDNPYAISLIGGDDFDPASKLIFAAFSTAPSAAYKRHIDTLVRAMKLTGDWSKAYLIYDLAAETVQQTYINWKNPGTNTLTKAGTVTHVAGQGSTPGGAAADGLQSDWNPSTAGVGTDNVAVTLYSRTTTAAASRTDWGVQAASWSGRLRIGGDTGQVRLNNTANVSFPASMTATIGLFSWLRNANAVMQICKDGAQLGSDIPVTSQAPPSSTLNIGNSNIGTGSSTQRQLSFFMVSQARTLTQEATLAPKITAFLTSRGVI